MRFYIPSIAAVLLAMATNAGAATINFSKDPFAGSAALTTPGRQIVGNERFVNFDIAIDKYVFDPNVFPITEILFANDEVGNLPSSGVNVIVLQTFDNDANPLTPFGAGNAATLIANQITSPGPGFFIYFNSGLDLPRLVFSTDLDDATADLKVLARMVNLSGLAGRNQLVNFTAGNFAISAPEPGTLLLLMTSAGMMTVRRYRLHTDRRAG